eukprot:scaffold82043_cov56-Phaeocystis_antarctica.AAC.1
MRVWFSDDRGGERSERSNGRSVGRKRMIHAATWVGAYAVVGSVRLAVLWCVDGNPEWRVHVSRLPLSLECTLIKPYEAPWETGCNERCDLRATVKVTRG